MREFAVGMDLGGTHARAAVVDAAGRVLGRQRQALDSRDARRVAELLTSCALGALEEAGRTAKECGGWGLGLAGQVEGGTGRILTAPNLGWRRLDFGPLISSQLGVPVLLMNDLSAAAWGEAKVGAARGYGDAALIFVGSGVGAGLVLGGAVYEGARGLAGEFGHIKVVPEGRCCGCGERGCLEAYAGGHGLGELAAEAMAAGRATSLEVPEGLKPTAVLLDRAAARGDRLSAELLDQAARFVGVASANLVTLLNPAVLIFGGGVLGGSERMRGGVERALRGAAARAALEGLLIVDAVLGDDAGVTGAALAALANH